MTSSSFNHHLIYIGALRFCQSILSFCQSFWWRWFFPKFCQSFHKMLLWTFYFYELLMLVIVNWDDTRKEIELELSLYQLYKTIISRSYDVQEQLFVVLYIKTSIFSRFLLFLFQNNREKSNPYQKTLHSNVPNNQLFL